MNDLDPSSGPAPTTPPAKKTSPLVWVLLGCLGLILLAALAAAGSCYFLGRKAKQVAERFEQNPVQQSAEMIVRLNPDLELVESDPERGTMTIRQKSTGETVTVDFEDVQRGEIRFSTEEGEGSIALNQQGLEIDTPDAEGTGRRTTSIGSDSAPPAWVPVFPGATAAGGMRSRSDGRTDGTATYDVDAEPAEILAFYESELRDLGLSVERQDFSYGTETGGMVSGRSADGGRDLSVTVSSGEGSELGRSVAIVAYGERD